jgi:DNA polymerase-4
VASIGELAALTDSELATLLPGKLGLELRARAQGIDRRRVEPVSEPPVSISHEETFDRDVGERERLHDELRRMAESLSRRLHDRGLLARTVTTKLRYGDFTTRTRSTTLPTATDEAERIAGLACELLDRALDQRPGALRLVGVGVSGLQGEGQLALV